MACLLTPYPFSSCHLLPRGNLSDESLVRRRSRTVLHLHVILMRVILIRYTEILNNPQNKLLAKPCWPCYRLRFNITTCDFGYISFKRFGAISRL